MAYLIQNIASHRAGHRYHNGAGHEYRGALVRGLARLIDRRRATTAGKVDGAFDMPAGRWKPYENQQERRTKYAGSQDCAPFHCHRKETIRWPLQKATRNKS